MKIFDRRKEADAALADAQTHERAWLTQTRAVRAWCTDHRAGVIVGSGVATGLMTSLLPVAPLMRLFSALAGTVSLMFEGPLLQLLTTHRDGEREAPSTETRPTPQ